MSMLYIHRRPVPLISSLPLREWPSYPSRETLTSYLGYVETKDHKFGLCRHLNNIRKSEATGAHIM